MFVLRAFALAAVVAGTVCLIDGAARSSAAAEERTASFVSPESAFTGPSPQVTQTQEDEQDTASGNDDRVAVQVWTVLAAGGAAAVGLVLFLLRLALGLVKPAPPQQDESHH